METILGIDLGTTNSVVSILRDGQPTAIRREDGLALLPSAVGLDHEGRLLVGQAARNQALLAPERTILSVKRRMGEEVRLNLGDQRLTPQEVSAIILRTLKEQAERHLGHPVTKAVITVPAFFSENQRAATAEAGVLAGLEVVRIINEPTAASLTYQPQARGHEKLLVYDLGGGTFDVSIVQIEEGVVEVLSSHGDTHLGGDDFDRLLLDYVCQQFRKEHGDVDFRDIPVARSRLLQAVEAAKCRLSYEAYTTIQEPFLAEVNGKPVNLDMTIDRSDYEQLIEPLLKKTVACVDAALADAKLNAKDIDRVILVGGSTRTPMVYQLLSEQLGQEPQAVVDPDLCVSLGAAIQAGLISGIDVGPILVDITPRTLGIRVLGQLHGVYTTRCFSPLIHRNTALPASRSELYCTVVKGQKTVQIDIYQGENDNVEFNEPVGSFRLDGLDESADANNQILVRFDLDVNATLHVTAIERATGREKRLTIDNAITQFRAKDRDEARERINELFGSEAAVPALLTEDQMPDPIGQRASHGQMLLSRAQRLMAHASREDAVEIQQMIDDLQTALDQGDDDEVHAVSDKLEDVLFYLEDA